MKMSNSHRALTIVYDYFSYKGGAARIARSIDTALCDNGWRVDVLTHDFSMPDIMNSCLRIFHYNVSNNRDSSLPVGQYLSMSTNVLTQAKALYDENNYSLIIAHHYLAGLALLNFKLNYRINTVFVCHGIRKNHFACYPHEESNPIANPSEGWREGTEAAMTEAMHILESEAICSASKVSCVSASVAKEVCDYWPTISPEVINNFYCLDTSNVSEKCWKNNFRADPNQRIILFAGRWEKTKGCDIVAEIARRMTLVCRFLFVHAGVIIDPPNSPHVIHLGHLDDVQLINLYQNAKILLMPSRYEPFGLTAIEAMWHGTPVLAHKVGGLAETIEDGVNGWLMDTLDPAQWCDRISALLSEDSNAEIHPEKIRQIAIKRFERHKPIEKYLAMFRGLIGPQQGQPNPQNVGAKYYAK